MSLTLPSPLCRYRLAAAGRDCCRRCRCRCLPTPPPRPALPPTTASLTYLGVVYCATGLPCFSRIPIPICLLIARRSPTLVKSLPGQRLLSHLLGVPLLNKLAKELLFSRLLRVCGFTIPPQDRRPLRLVSWQTVFVNAYPCQTPFDPESALSRVYPHPVDSGESYR